MTSNLALDDLRRSDGMHACALPTPTGITCIVDGRECCHRPRIGGRPVPGVAWQDAKGQWWYWEGITAGAGYHRAASHAGALQTLTAGLAGIRLGVKR